MKMCSFPTIEKNIGPYPPGGPIEALGLEVMNKDIQSGIIKVKPRPSF